MKKLCPICKSPLSAEFLLKNMPSAAQAFCSNLRQSLTMKTDMPISKCMACGTVQYMGPIISNYKNVIRSTKLSTEMIKFRKEQFQKLVQYLNKSGVSVFELGAGGGEHLDIFKELGCVTAGVENSNCLAKVCRNNGHDVLCGFLGKKSKQLTPVMGKYDFAVSFNFIEHLPNPRASLLALSNYMRLDGFGLFEVPNFELIEREQLFNEFIPDHRFYFSKDSFHTLLTLSGFEVIYIKSVWNEYILSALVRKRPPTDWSKYERRRLDLSSEIETFFSGTRPDENAIWSAGHQSLATISNLGIEKHVSCVIDSSKNKQGLFCPVSGLKVFSPEHLFSNKIRKILIMAAGFNDEIKKIIRNDISNTLIVAQVNNGKIEYDEKKKTN